MKTPFLVLACLALAAGAYTMWFDEDRPRVVGAAAEPPDPEAPPTRTFTGPVKLQPIELREEPERKEPEPEEREPKHEHASPYAINDEPLTVADRRLLAEEGVAYKWLFGTTDMAGLLLERDVLEIDYMEATGPLFEERFENGVYEHLKTANGQVVAAPGEDFVMEAHRILKDGSYYRAVLPRGEYPELYDIRKRMRWMNELIRTRESEARLAGVTEAEKG